MGATGSHTAKITMIPELYAFTKFYEDEVEECWCRGMYELSETFALRRSEFEFLLNSKLVGLSTCRYLFHEVMDTDSNELVDKFETMCMIVLASALSNTRKVQMLFDLFNLNDKGYLTESEVSLMVLSIARAVEKVDPKWPVPAKPAWLHLVQLSLKHFAVVDTTKKSLRKPELVKFASETAEVARYLDAWRGHASQVLVAGDEQWKDVFFPCNESAIVPLQEWTNKGLPPNHFVRWRRRIHVGSIVEKNGCPRFFSHDVSTLRTRDKRKLYHGPGVLGTGSLQQSLLADRWVLNAVAVVASRAECFLHLFAPTGQEEGVGRYNLRFFEGMGWRSVFVDDRLPCNLLCEPLFSTTSDPQEACLLLLEKGLAKYMGSYGNIALSSDRHDSTLFGLRLLTGGHVYREAVLDYMWKNARADIAVDRGEKDGAQHILELLQEGSIVSFGRSESLALHSTAQRKNRNVTVATRQAELEDEDLLRQLREAGIDPDAEADQGRAEAFLAELQGGGGGGVDANIDPDTGKPRLRKVKGKVKLPPHGRIYPVIACYDEAGGDKFVHLRDSFGELLSIYGTMRNDNPTYQKDDRKYVDERSGYCRWVKVPLEDIPAMFDTIFIARFPDSLKLLCPKMRLPQWRTDVVKGKTMGPAKPARFSLKVLGGALPPPAPPASDVETRLSKLEKAIEKEMVVDGNIVSQDYIVTFDFDQYRYFPSAQRPPSDYHANKAALAAAAAVAAAEEAEAEGEGEGEGEGDEGGEEAAAAAAKNRASALALKRAELERHRRVELAVTVASSVPWAVAGSSAAGAQLRLRVVPSLETVRELRSIREQFERLRRDESAAVLEREEAMRKLLAVEDEQEEEEEEEEVAQGGGEGEGGGEKERLDDEEDEESSAEESGSGSGSGSDDDSDDSDASDATPDSAARRKKKKEEEEAAARRKQEELDEERALLLEVAQKETVLLRDWFEVRHSGPQAWLSVPLSLFPGQYTVLCDVSYDMDKARLRHLSRPKDPTEAPWLQNRPLEIEAVWMTVSSVGRYEARALDGDPAKGSSRSPPYARHVKDVTMRPSLWPFATENQHEVSSRALTDMLTHLRRQVDTRGAELVSMTRTFTTKWGPQLAAWRSKMRNDAAEAARLAKEMKRSERAKRKKEAERQARKAAEEEMKAMRKEQELEDERKAKFARQKRGFSTAKEKKEDREKAEKEAAEAAAAEGGAGDVSVVKEEDDEEDEEDEEDEGGEEG